MTVGSATGPSSYIATEFMDLESQKWSTGPEYPFHSKISGYSTTETSLSSYIIGDGDPRTVRPVHDSRSMWIPDKGGRNGPERVTTIAEYNASGWSKIGDLVNPREYHTSISYNGETMIFGGSFSEIITTEVWNFTTGDYREIQPELSSGEYWNSILFLVENDYCKIKS